MGSMVAEMGSMVAEMGSMVAEMGSMLVAAKRSGTSPWLPGRLRSSGPTPRSAGAG